MGRESLNYRRGRGGRPFERAKKRAFNGTSICARCGKSVDMALPYRDPVTGKVNRMSKSFGHRTELDKPGTDPYDGRVEHLSCNARAGAEYGNRKHNPSRQELHSSPDWD